jgi:hypothetical protein
VSLFEINEMISFIAHYTSNRYVFSFILNPDSKSNISVGPVRTLNSSLSSIFNGRVSASQRHLRGLFDKK